MRKDGISLPVFKLMSQAVRYKVKHKKRYSISTNNRVKFFLVYKHTDNDSL